jgi:hypothetical protein
MELYMKVIKTTEGLAVFGTVALAGSVSAVLVSLCVAGGASAQPGYPKPGYQGDDATAYVRIKNKEPKKVESISWFFERDRCGNGIFYNGKVRNLRVTNDRFKWVKNTYKIVGQFSANAKRIKVTITQGGEHPCEINDVLKFTRYPTPFL